MKITQISVLALMCAAAPLAARAGVEIGIGINIPGPEIVVRTAPPVERYEVVGRAPGPGYIYIRGHWAWHHEHWEWISGRWELPANGATWVAGQWVARGNGWVWVEGHYVTNYAPPPGPPVGEVYVDVAPPAPVAEVIPVAPGPDFFWIGGRWQWNGRWVWVNGHFDRHPHYHPGAYWENGHWDNYHGRYVWREGHWH
jgi:hypothetical protein